MHLETIIAVVLPFIGTVVGSGCVFYMKGADDYTQLPEDTSLQRSLKQRYLAGGRLNEYGGIMPFDWVRAPEDLWK